MNFKRIKDMIDRNKTISLSQYPIEELDLMDYIEWYNPDGSLRISDSSDEKPWCPAAGKPKERYDSEEAAKKKQDIISNDFPFTPRGEHISARCVIAGICHQNLNMILIREENEILHSSKFFL